MQKDLVDPESSSQFFGQQFPIFRTAVQAGTAHTQQHQVLTPLPAPVPSPFLQQMSPPGGTDPHPCKQLKNTFLSNTAQKRPDLTSLDAQKPKAELTADGHFTKTIFTE